MTDAEFLDELERRCDAGVIVWARFSETSRLNIILQSYDAYQVFTGVEHQRGHLAYWGRPSEVRPLIEIARTKVCVKFVERLTS